MSAEPRPSCPFTSKFCWCPWGENAAETATTASVSDSRGSVGAGAIRDLKGAQIGADAIEGDL